jgi:hypothetical protein
MTMRGLGLAFCLLSLLAVGATASSAEAEDGTRFCNWSLNVQKSLADRIGRQIDPVTRLANISVRCDEKSILFTQELRVSSSELQPGWLKRLRANWSMTYCREQSESANAIHSGWKVETLLSTPDGQKFRLTAVCNDQVAINFSRGL